MLDYPFEAADKITDFDADHDGIYLDVAENNGAASFASPNKVPSDLVNANTFYTINLTANGKLE